MGGLLVAGLSMIKKKIFIDAFTNPEKILKYLMFFIILPLLIIALIFVVPIFLFTKVPLLLLDIGSTPEISAEQLQIIAIYQNAPIESNKEALKWIEEKKKEYSWADDIVVNSSFNLTWQHVMALDSVLREQDYNNVSQNEVLKIANNFIVKSATTERYTEDEEYEDEEDYWVTEKDKDGKDKRIEKTRTVTKTRSVTKTRAIISLSTKSLDSVIKEYNLSVEKQGLVLDIYNTISNFDVEGNLNIYDDIDLADLKEYPPGSANLPYFHQADKRWGYERYGSSNIKDSGCGPTSLSMVVAGLKRRTDVNPKTMADWSYANGHRAEGAGSYWSLMTAGGQSFGLKVETVSRKNPQKIVQALSQGYPVIASMGRGHFTRGGHFIVLRGLTSDGKILVHDPSSATRSNQAWDLSIIMNESSTLGGVSGNPFWVFKP